eukprot:352609-Chlamydomonas_euryale.AAC.4
MSWLCERPQANVHRGTFQPSGGGSAAASGVSNTGCQPSGGGGAAVSGAGNTGLYPSGGGGAAVSGVSGTGLYPTGGGGAAVSGAGGTGRPASSRVTGARQTVPWPPAADTCGTAAAPSERPRLRRGWCPGRKCEVGNPGCGGGGSMCVGGGVDQACSMVVVAIIVIGSKKWRVGWGRVSRGLVGGVDGWGGRLKELMRAWMETYARKCGAESTALRTHLDVDP